MRPSVNLSQQSRTRTHLFDLPPAPPPPFRRPRPPRKHSTENSTSTSHLTDVNPFLRILKGSLRRCLLTQKVLPVDMMIPLKQLSIPSTSTATAAKAGGGMILIPKGLQHPRFEEKVGGKGGWVMCHHQALGELALKGSYKRLNPQLSMPKNVQNLKEWTLHQLVKRLEQEVEMYCERAKSWPKLKVNGERGSRFLPVRRMRTVEETLNLREEAGQIEMVLDLRELNEIEGGHDDKIILWKRRKEEGGQGKEFAVWKFGQTLRTVVDLPNTSKATTASPSPSSSTDPSTPVTTDSGTRHSSSSLDSVKSQLDAMISLFERRLARHSTESSFEVVSPTESKFQAQGTNIESQDGGEGEVYVFYSPSPAPTGCSLDTEAAKDSDNEAVDTITRMKKDLVDLCISCWRIGLLNGNGWEEM